MPFTARHISRRISRTSPPVVLALLYASLVLVGAALFRLPVATTTPIGWSDALFMATSAVTVTGLSVIDIGSQFTGFGQVVLAVLIQLGGLGLMTFAMLIFAALGMPVGVAGQVVLREDLGQTSMYRLSKLVSTILRTVLLCEVVGALFLLVPFVRDFGLSRGTWHAVFHAISAFNNAGFSTFSRGLVPYATDPVVNLVIPALFIIGGIGYVVLTDLARSRNWHRWTLQTKVMLVGTAVLIPLSMAMFAAMEWTNPATLGALAGWPDRLMVSWFQAVTPRTAGFNTTDIAGMTDSTSLMMMSLMVIGGGPTSTAGGIKVTTFVVMILATVAFFRRRTQLSAFGRSIGLEQVLKVMALTLISVFVVFVGIFLIALSHDGQFLDICFEVASAFGTVGLTRDYTSSLNDFGRVVIVVIMFLGRVGPLTLGFFLATRTQPRIRYPEADIHLG